jgi:hypothetical protein
MGLIGIGWGISIINRARVGIVLVVHCVVSPCRGLLNAVFMLA